MAVGANAQAVQAAEAKVVAALAKEAVDKALEEKPDRRLLEIKAENLKKPAEGIAQVAPLVVSIAAKIVAQVLQMGA